MAVVCALICSGLHAREWQPDILNNGYEMQTIDMPDDYSGKVRCTVVRKQPTCQVDDDDKTAILYLHGFNDYFFQRDLGDSIVAHGYGFYALELRKYGRSLLPGQRMFEVRNIEEYFRDIDTALDVIVSDGYDCVVFIGHSTGGLTLCSYLWNRQSESPLVKGLILNSPFLDMNLSGFQENILIPLVSVLPFKDIEISQGDSRAYAESLLKKYHGEWDYDTRWKLEISPDVTIGWISAIHRAQSLVQEGGGIGIPILLMHSDKSVGGDNWTPDYNRGDGVLDVADISRYGRQLGPRVSELVVVDGMHDLILSQPNVRRLVYAKMFHWLKVNGF